jgi:amino acid adenylation domain-containing protein
VVERDGGWALSFIYDQALFEEATIARMSQHLLQLLTSVIEANAAQPLPALTMMSMAEQAQVLHALNATAVDFPTTECLHELFESQAMRAPDAIALIYQNQILTYGALEAQSNRVAHCLRTHGVGPDVLVGLCVERSLEMVIGILGILKAGGAYVPLDPNYPADRLAYMLQDSAPAVLLTQQAVASVLPGADIPRVYLDGDAAAWMAYPITPLPVASIGLRPDHLAYVIYTSGSTGRPKGVMVEHRQVTNLTHGFARRARDFVSPGPHLRWGAMASYAFDASVQGWAQLMLGHTLVIAAESERYEADALRSFLQRHAPDVLDCTPTLLELWLNDGLEAILPDLVIGGESINPSLWRRLVGWQARYGKRALNVYGPTECCVNSTYTVIDGARPCIGQPWENTYCYLLDSTGQPVPIGVIGEIHIGGAGVARGYLHQGALTAERFVRDPFRKNGEGRMYRTGDLGRWLPDGMLEHLGRNDFQVKIRGLRIELGEIEHQLMALPQVTGALVAVQHGGADAQLVAYVTSPIADQDTAAQGTQRAHWQEALRQRLPDYMLPVAWVVLAAWPLLPNGKIDRQILREAISGTITESRREPATETEIALARLWETFLHKAPSADASFFELGGHSLMATRLLAEINKVFKVSIEIRQIFTLQTIQAMAAYIEKYQLDRAVVLPQIETPSCVVTIRPGAPNLPAAFLIHPVGGSVYCYADLAAELAYPGTLYGIQADHALTSNGIEEMASRYIQAAQLILGDREYILGGWSIGGVIAYEMARQLTTAKARPKIVFMIDSFRPDLLTNTLTPAEIDAMLLRNMALELGITEKYLTIEQQKKISGRPIEDLLPLFIEIGREQGRLPATFGVNDLEKRFSLAKNNAEAIASYIPGPIKGKINLIRADHPTKQDASDWSPLVTQLAEVECEGSHFSIMHRPHVSALAERLDALFKGDVGVAF